PHPPAGMARARPRTDESLGSLRRRRDEDDGERSGPPASASQSQHAAQTAQSRTGARDRVNEEEGSSRSAVSRRVTAAGDAHWAVAPIRRERRGRLWGGGRPLRSEAARTPPPGMTPSSTHPAPAHDVHSYLRLL